MPHKLKIVLFFLASVFLISCDYLSNNSKKLDCSLVDSTKDQNKMLIFEGQAGNLTINTKDQSLIWLSNIEPTETTFLKNFKSSNTLYSAENSFSIDWTDGKKEEILRTIVIDRMNLLMTYSYSSNETNLKKNLAERKYQCSLAVNKI